MVITDHINLMPNPLIGRNIAELGPRFPDMHNCYDRELRAKATAIAEREGIKLQYASTSAARALRSRLRPNTAISRRSAAMPPVCPPCPK